MKRTIKIQDITKTERVVEIEHPIFRQYGDTLDSGSSYDVFERWDADGTEWSITENEGRGSERSYEIERSRRVSGNADSPDFICGEGKYRCKPEEFEAALNRARKFLALITPPSAADQAEG